MGWPDIGLIYQISKIYTFVKTDELLLEGIKLT